MPSNGKITANPYQVGGKIRDLNQFIGREREVRDILSRVATMQSVSIVGERRIGKSSLLLYLKENGKQLLDDETIEFFYLDFQEPINSPDEFYLRACELMNGNQAERPVTFSAQDKFDSVVEGRKVVWCLDEFEQTIEEDFSADFFKHLRHLSQSGNLSLIVATQSPLDELYRLKQDMTSGFPNVFSTLRLGELTKEDAHELVARPRNGHCFTETDIKEILRIAGRHPYWLNYACSQAYLETDFSEIERAIASARYGAAHHNDSDSQQTKEDSDQQRSNLQSDSSTALVGDLNAPLRWSLLLAFLALLIGGVGAETSNPVGVFIGAGILLISVVNLSRVWWVWRGGAR